VSLKAENIGKVVGYIRCPIVLLCHLIFKKNTVKTQNISDQQHLILLIDSIEGDYLQTRANKIISE
jgi:hypothetical protein